MENYSRRSFQFRLKRRETKKKMLEKKSSQLFILHLFRLHKNVTGRECNKRKHDRFLFILFYFFFAISQMSAYIRTDLE